MVNNIKLSDFVASFIAENNVRTVFAISGGASLHLIHSISDHKKLSYVCTSHEQGAAMAADGYSRATGNFGVVIATSGPGATNLITGIGCSFYDSVPLLVITGQVSTFRMAGSLGVRQIGFQETPITSMVKPITKYCTQITDPLTIKYELEKSLSIALNDRPGPVLIDIPDNLQRELIDPTILIGYKDKTHKHQQQEFISFTQAKDKFFELIQKAKRPVLIAGWGIHLSNMEDEFIKFAEFLNIPIALTWGGADLIPNNHQLYIGTFGTHGMRHANFAVQNSDLIISLGSRLDTKATGSPITTFAREAKKIMIDIDPSELGKFSTFGLNFDLLIQEDLREFFRIVNLSLSKKLDLNLDEWKIKINDWEANFSEMKESNIIDLHLEPYRTFKIISQLLPLNAYIYIDTGCSIAWSMQCFQIKQSQRIFHDFNNTAMGWALPASIGAYFSQKSDHIICIIGDGSLMMTLQELATVKHHKIPLKIILINNSGYSMIKQTQDQWMSSRYEASSKEGGLSFPNYKTLAHSFNLEYMEVSEEERLKSALQNLFESKKACLLDLHISEKARVSPQVKYGKPNEDMEPLLTRNIFFENMIIKPLPSSEEAGN